ncbi:arginine-hydroxylase NDUFAF5, mitochondrial [Copidosoma floridanum]|uniref:arginine-hydroxylase NDUFAF5, mitochondrial n=1 Tax=Copidosoma floridanum TaxID=29053 RepID=UPI0006C994A5|nr:arginine-hydroxylase NDUFAF5, mitochondrial [Copidosoma floridanum]
MVGWKPHESQPKPIERGSGEISLKDIHRIDEIAKEKKGIPKCEEKRSCDRKKQTKQYNEKHDYLKGLIA